MAMLRIQALGPFRMWRNGEVLRDDAWPTHKAKSLFKILLVERSHDVTADRLIEYLWPDLSPDKAQKNLWVAVSQLRRVLQPDLPPRAASDYIITNREGYAFSTQSDYWFDVDEFLRQLKAAEDDVDLRARTDALEAARKLYGGILFEEDVYADWAMSARERLGEAYMSLLDDLADAYARQGRYVPAIELCREILTHDNCREPTYRSLMLYHYCAGEQSAALNVYEECTRVLQAELGVVPMDETVDLYRQIQRRQVARAADYPPPIRPMVRQVYSLGQTPLVGREREYGQLVDQIGRAATGNGGVVLVEGEAGIGKSRLAQEAAGYASDRGLATLLVKCYQVEQAMPYQPVIDLLHQVLEAWPAEAFKNVQPASLAEIASLTPEMASMFPDLPALMPGLDAAWQTRLFRALVQFLRAVAGGRGLFLSVDDIHWADHATLQFLHHLARNTVDQPILLICAYRGEEIAANEYLSDLIHSLRREQNAAHLRLARLSLQQANTLLESLATISPRAGELAAWLHRETDGNPFFIISILQSLLEQGLLAGHGSAEWRYDLRQLDAAGVESTLPDALRESVRSRLRRVPAPVRKVVDVAAVLGRRFDFSTLQAVSHERQDALLDALENLTQRQLLREEQDSGFYDFSHDKVREVVYHDLSLTRRILLHRQVAEALEGLAVGRSAVGRQVDNEAALAEHFERGQVWNKALTYLTQVADHSRNLFAMREALCFYDRAIELAETHQEIAPDGTQSRLREQRGEARAVAGPFDGAIADLEMVRHAAHASGDRARERDVLIRLGQVLRKSERHDQAIHILREAVVLAQTAGDRRAEADALYHLGTISWDEGDNAQASQQHQRALAISRDLKLADIVAVQATHGMAESALVSGEPERAINLFRESLALARAIGDKGYEAENLQMIGWCSVGTLGTGDYRSAIDHYTGSLAIIESSSLSWHSVCTLIGLGLAQGCTGDYEQGLSNVRRGGEMAETLGVARFKAMVCDALGYLYLDLNLHERAAHEFARGIEISLRSETHFWLPRLQANLAITRLRMGKRAVEDDLQTALRIAYEGRQAFHAVRCMEGLAELALVNGDMDRAIGYADELKTLAVRSGMRENLARGHYWRGRALLALGAYGEAESDLQQGLAIANEIGRLRLTYDVQQALMETYRAQGKCGLAEQHETGAQASLSQMRSHLADVTLQSGLPAT